MKGINLYNCMRSTGIIIVDLTGFNHLVQEIIGVKFE